MVLGLLVGDHGWLDNWDNVLVGTESSSEIFYKSTKSKMKSQSDTGQVMENKV